jgi:hypothetical protein
MDHGVKRLNKILLLMFPAGVALSFMLHPVLFTTNDPVNLLCYLFEFIAACSILIDGLLNKWNIPLTRQPLMWLAAGVLFFSCTYALLQIMLNYVLNNIAEYFTLYAFIANTAEYGGFIGCFICLRREGAVTTKEAPLS